MERGSHVQVLLLLRGHDYWVWGVILISDVRHDCGLVCGVDSDRVFGAHSHLLFEVDLGLLITLLAILELSVSLVDQMIAGCDVIMSIVLNALLSIFLIEVVLN